MRHTSCWNKMSSRFKGQRQKLTEIEQVYQSSRVDLVLVDKDYRFARINESMTEINGHRSQPTSAACCARCVIAEVSKPNRT